MHYVVMNIPDWTKIEIKQLYADHGSWKGIKSKIHDISDKLGIVLKIENVYDIIFDVIHSDKNASCGNKKKFTNFTYGYQFCKRSCACSIAQRNENTKKTCLKKYGTEHFLSSSEIRDKIVATCQVKFGAKSPLSANSSIREKTVKTNLEKYGFDNPAKSPEVQKKFRETMISRYGVEHALQNKDIMERYKSTLEKNYDFEKIKEKSRNTNIERYGVDNPMKNIEIKERVKNTVEQRYGVSNTLLIPEVRKKIAQTNLIRYGTVFPIQSEIIKEKRKHTNLARYGVEFSTQSSIKDCLFILENKELLLASSLKETIPGLARILGINYTTIYNYWHKHGLDLEVLGNISSHEIAIRDFLEENKINFVWNDRNSLSSMQIDFLLPEYKLAIEINGLYWHCSKFKPKLYHQTKFIQCQKAGFRLLMINEDEWLQRPDCIKSRIINMIGQSPKGLPARKLFIRKISSTAANSFLSKYHIQGATSGGITCALAAFSFDTIVGVMTFGKQRGTGDVEMTRFCNDSFTHSGMFSKLLKHAVNLNGFNKIITFADLRYSTGELYTKNGFIRESDIGPDYKYVKNNKTFHKSAFTKSKIAKKLGIDVTNISEREAMEISGFERIYDCGKIKFVWSDA